MTHVYAPRTHSLPHAIKTPVLPLKISPCPPTLFNPPLTLLTSTFASPLSSVCAPLSGAESPTKAVGMGRPFEMMSVSPFWMMVTFCKAEASWGQRVCGSDLGSIF